MVLVLKQNREFRFLLTKHQRQNCCHGNSSKGVILILLWWTFIYGTKFQEHCLNISRDIAYSVFTTFQLQYYNIISDLICIKEKRHSSVFWKVFQISRNIFCVIYTLIKPETTSIRNSLVFYLWISQLYRFFWCT